MSQITTHILDTTKGKPAAGVRIVLFHEEKSAWKEMTSGVTNKDGRIAGLLKADAVLAPGNYKLRFETKAYFDQEKIASFYPFVDIVFAVSGEEHYHIPLLLNPYGFTTYRGS